MTKQFTCHKCGKYLGEMDKGRIIGNAVLTCASCYSIIERRERREAGSDKAGFDYLNQMFGGFGK